MYQQGMREKQGDAAGDLVQNIYDWSKGMDWGGTWDTVKGWFD